MNVSSSSGTAAANNNNNYNNNNNNTPGSSSLNYADVRSTSSTIPASPTGSSPSNNFPFSLQLPLKITSTAIHRRNFHKSWVCGSMIVSLDVMNTNAKTELPELRQVTSVYTAALDGAVVAGAAFPATQILHSPRVKTHNKVASGGKSSNQLDEDVVACCASQSSSSSSGGGLAIRHRPLARFLQMARSDTVLNFASIGDYNAEICSCCVVSSSSTTSTSSPVQQQKKEPQRKRSFVTITAKGTVALWTFYDLLVENEVIRSS